jgi:hypothetical protein
MKSFTKAAMLVSVATVGLGLAACDSKSENAAEDQAAIVREAGDATGDALDAAADATSGAAENALENKADAARSAADNKADRMEDAADQKDAGTPE